MYNAEVYMQEILKALKKVFGGRLLYVGLQGSYLRGEATQDSDIDVVVVIDALSVQDLTAYKSVLSVLACPEKSCGFICGREELQNWNPLEVCNFLHGSKTYYGTLSALLPQYTGEDVANFIKLSVGNMYHEICHRYVHADLQKNMRKLPDSYRNVFFILQSVQYLRTGIFYPTKKELISSLSDKDREAMKRASELKDAKNYDFEEYFHFLFAWCQNTLCTLPDVLKEAVI